MQVGVYQDGTLIGTAILEHLDPPMGVAFGPFVPSDQYDRDQHANIVEGDYVGDRGKSLSACADQHGPLKTASIAIEDSGDPEIGKELTVWSRMAEILPRSSQPITTTRHIMVDRSGALAPAAPADHGAAAVDRERAQRP